VPFALASGWAVRRAMGDAMVGRLAMVASAAAMATPCPIDGRLAASWWQVAPCVGLAVACRTVVGESPRGMLALALVPLGVPGGHRYSIALALLWAGRCVRLPGGAAMAALSRAVYWTHPLVPLALYKLQAYSAANAMAGALALSCLIVGTRLRKYV
jgi:hypothetical protein